VNGYCYWCGFVWHKASKALRPFLIYCLSSSECKLFLIHAQELSGNNQQKHLVATQEKTWREMAVNSVYEVLFSYLKASLTCRKILQHGTYGFTSPPKEVVLRIFIYIKSPSSSSGLNSRTLGPMASAVTTRPPTATGWKHKMMMTVQNDKCKISTVKPEASTPSIHWWSSTRFPRGLQQFCMHFVFPHYSHKLRLS
jgi:hypothetical protein